MRVTIFHSAAAAIADEPSSCAEALQAGGPAPRTARPGRDLWRIAMLGALLLSGMGVPSCAAADLALGEYLSGECVGCHQISGEATGSIPSIVGMPQGSFIAALTAYKTGQRENPVMRNIAGRLTEEEIAALAAFFAAQKQ
jgi:cytochrome c